MVKTKGVLARIDVGKAESGDAAQVGIAGSQQENSPWETAKEEKMGSNQRAVGGCGCIELGRFTSHFTMVAIYFILFSCSEL